MDAPWADHGAPVKNGRILIIRLQPYLKGGSEIQLGNEASVSGTFSFYFNLNSEVALF